MVDFPPKDLAARHIVVVGSGTLGRRVGLVWAVAGNSVTLVDTNQDVASQALCWIQAELPSRVKAIHGSEGKVFVNEISEQAVRGAWLVVECIPEIKPAKIELLGNLDKWCDQDTIIATISSSYKSSELVDNVSEAGRARVLNTHYFRPPEMPPVEIMSSGSTDPAIIDLMVRQLKEIGLVPVVAQKQTTGFIYGRIWAALKREVMMVLADGVSTPEDIVSLFRYCFQSKGAPCQLMDSIGLQTVCDIEDHYVEERENLPRYPVDFIRKKYVDKGHIGAGSGKGLYDYRSNARPP